MKEGLARHECERTAAYLIIIQPTTKNPAQQRHVLGHIVSDMSSSATEVGPDIAPADIAPALLLEQNDDDDDNGGQEDEPETDQRQYKSAVRREVSAHLLVDVRQVAPLPPVVSKERFLVRVHAHTRLGR